MTLASALLIIVILLAFDAVFFGLLLRRKRRILFSILIEEGVIKSHDGDIPAEFLFDVEQLSRMYKPSNIKISGKRNRDGSSYLEFSGPMPEELREKYRQALDVSLQK